MTNTPRWRRYLRFWRPDVDGDIDDELRFHFESRDADLRALGVPADEVKRRIAEEFGDERATRERLHEIGERRKARRARVLWWDTAGSDLRYALRGLRSNALLTTTIIIALAIGIGATTAMYGVMRRLLLAPPPHVAAPDALAKVYFRAEPEDDSAQIYDRFSYPFFEQLRREMRTLAGIAVYLDQQLVVGRGRGAGLARATMTSAGFWSTLGVSPLAGRFIADEEAHPATGARVVVLGHAFWQRRYGGDRGVIGQTLAVKGLPYQIIGIAPRGFRGIELTETDVWLPLFAYEDGSERAIQWHLQPGSFMLAYVVRLRPGVATAQAEADATAQHRAHSEHVGDREGSPAPRFPPTSIRLGELTGALDRNMTRLPEATVSAWLVGVAALLLAIACANVAGLLLLRALRRRREIAVRLALGMSRRRLAALLFVESGLLALLGAVASIVVIVWGGEWVERVMLTNIAVERPGFDWRMLGVAAACTIGTAFVAGLVPLLQIRGAITAGLREGGQHGSARRSWMHRGLLVGQTALSVVLLVGAGLFLRSLHRISSLDLGMDVQNVLAVSVDFTATGRSGRDRIAFFERALERVRALPGVHAASVSTEAPLKGARGGGFMLPGAERPVTSPDGGLPFFNSASDGFFEATGMRIVRGRGFTTSDRTGPPVIVVNEALASLAWPGQSGVGECVFLLGAKDVCTTVVGVVANARTFRLLEENRTWFYQPLAPDDVDSRVLLVHVAPGTVDAMSGTVRRVVQELETDVPYVDVSVLGDRLDPEMRPWRMGATLFTAFGVLAALLAALGLYSAVAYAVTQRTREIGVRMAVGAVASDVMGLIVGDGLRIATVGVALGLFMAIAGSAWIRELLFETSTRDPLVLGVVGGGLIVLAVVASLGPARRAWGVNPAVALRVD
ncbi:MAG: ADOP family duplicated permease [Gemmatimonadota bacterium]|nr:ADOP family duplicated permease [Gemmatimonadota bacterium]